MTASSTFKTSLLCASVLTSALFAAPLLAAEAAATEATAEAGGDARGALDQHFGPDDQQGEAGEEGEGGDHGVASGAGAVGFRVSSINSRMRRYWSYHASGCT